MITKFHLLRARFLLVKVCVIITRLGGFEFILGISDYHFPFDFNISLFFDFVRLFKVVFLKVVVVIVRFQCLFILFFLLKFLMQLFVFKKEHRVTLEFCLIQPFLFLVIILLLLIIYVFFLVLLLFDFQQLLFALEILFF